MKQTEILTHATHVNGWEPAVYMSCMSQNFRLFHLSNLSVRNFRIFLLMYTGSMTPQTAGSCREPTAGRTDCSSAPIATAARRRHSDGRMSVHASQRRTGHSPTGYTSSTNSECSERTDTRNTHGRFDSCISCQRLVQFQSQNFQIVLRIDFFVLSSPLVLLV